jgi:hypothetical protein
MAIVGPQFSILMINPPKVPCFFVRAFEITRKGSGAESGAVERKIWIPAFAGMTQAKGSGSATAIVATS